MLDGLLAGGSVARQCDAAQSSVDSLPDSAASSRPLLSRLSCTHGCQQPWRIPRRIDVIGMRQRIVKAELNLVGGIVARPESRHPHGSEAGSSRKSQSWSVMVHFFPNGGGSQHHATEGRSRASERSVAVQTAVPFLPQPSPDWGPRGYLRHTYGPVITVLCPRLSSLPACRRASGATA